jgi:hypothetical protein
MVVRNGDAESQAIAQLTRRFLPPDAALGSIAAAGVGRNEDVAGLRTTFVSFDFAATCEGRKRRRRKFRVKLPGTHSRGWPGYRRCQTECRCPWRWS